MKVVRTIDLHSSGIKVSKRLAKAIKPYEDYIFEEYWFGGRSFEDIARELKFVSGVSLYRYMKEYSYVKTNSEKLADLHKTNTGLIRSKEQIENARQGLLRYYSNCDNGRFDKIRELGKDKARSTKLKIEGNVGNLEKFLQKEYVANRKSAFEISKMIGKSQSYVVELLHEYNIPIRSRSENSTGKRYKRTDEVKSKLRKAFSDPEVKKRRSEAQKKCWKNVSYEDRIKRTRNGCLAGFEANKNNVISSIESVVKNQLDSMDVRYIQQKKISFGGRNFYLDFYIPSLKLVIECNGDYWHNLPERKQRDKELKEYVESTGRKIIFIWEHEIKDDWFWIGDYLEVFG